MSIAWNYLDKRSAAMAALKDYRSMKAILATTAEEIANVRQDMAWFQPAWDALGEDEKTVLTMFYLSENGKTDAIEEISERFCVERSSAYKKKDRALAHLALLLYGR